MVTEVQTLTVVDVKDDLEAAEADKKDAVETLERHLEAIKNCGGAYLIAYTDADGNQVGLVGSSIEEALELYIQVLNSFGIMFGAATGDHAEQEDHRIIAAMGALAAKVADKYPHMKPQIALTLMVLGATLAKDKRFSDVDTSSPDALLNTLFRS